MASSKSVFFLTSFMAFILFSVDGQTPHLFHFCVNKTGFYSNGSMYKTNLDNLLSSLPSHIDQYGYSNLTSGQDPDRANAVALCRGDVDRDTCRNCVDRSVPMLKELCPQNKAAVLWLDDCMIRYSNRTLTGSDSISNDETFWVYNLNNVTDPGQFNRDVNSLLEDLKPKAAAGGARLKFAAGKKDGPNSQTIYAITQCAPDLSEQQCSDCLTRTFSLYPNCCDGRIGGRVITPNCNFRYEITAFYNHTNLQALAPSPSPQASNPTLQLAPPPPQASNPALQLAPPPGSGGKKKTLASMAVSVSSLLLILLIFI